jgi:hypothetical protein
MHSARIALWAVSLVLQGLLLAILIGRAWARRVPVFTVLIAFYIVRSVALFALPGHLKPGPFAGLYDAFSLADVVLQLAVTAEIALAAARQYGEEGRDRLARALLLLLAGVLAAVLATALLPSRGPAPVDRGSVLAAFLMLLLWLWMTVERLRGPARRVAEGFAAYGAVAITANVIHNQAGLHRSEGVFRTASWAQSIAWVLAVVFWCLTLRGASSAIVAPQRERVRA